MQLYKTMIYDKHFVDKNLKAPFFKKISCKIGLKTVISKLGFSTVNSYKFNLSIKPYKNCTYFANFKLYD